MIRLNAVVADLRGVDQRNAVFDVILLVQKRAERASENATCGFAECCGRDVLGASIEKCCELTLEKGSSVLEVLFSVGFGGGDFGKGFVEEGDDAVLSFDDWCCYGNVVNIIAVDARLYPFGHARQVQRQQQKIQLLQFILGAVKLYEEGDVKWPVFFFS